MSTFAPLYNLLSMLKISNFTWNDKNTIFYIINKELYNGAKCHHIIGLLYLTYSNQEKKNKYLLSLLTSFLVAPQLSSLLLNNMAGNSFSFFRFKASYLIENKIWVFLQSWFSVIGSMLSLSSLSLQGQWVCCFFYF